MKNKSKIYWVQLAQAIGGRVVCVGGGPDKYAVAVDDWKTAADVLRRRNGLQLALFTRRDGSEGWHFVDGNRDAPHVNCGYSALSAADYADDVLGLVEAFTIDRGRADIAKYCRDARETLAEIARIPSGRVALVSDDLREIIEIVPSYEMYFRVEGKSADFAYMITRE